MYNKIPPILAPSCVEKVYIKLTIRYVPTETDAHIILYVGRIVPGKDHNTAIVHYVSNSVVDIAFVPHPINKVFINFSDNITDLIDIDQNVDSIVQNWKAIRFPKEDLPCSWRLQPELLRMVSYAIEIKSDID